MTESQKPATLMARIELEPEEWQQILKLAIDRGVTPRKLIGDVLREQLAEVTAA
jgi:hypothetical protein